MERGNRSIKHWPEGDRPREKLVRLGASALSDAELLAILLRTGARGVTALDRARQLLTGVRALRELARMTASDLRSCGFGTVHAATIVAAFELARRLEASGGSEAPVFRAPADVVARYGPLLRDLRHEEFWAILLSTANQPIRELRITSGTLNSSLVHPRECFAEAIKLHAASIIFLHNHPSGNPEPSQEDLAVTRQLVEAGRILGIPVHDHIILADGRYVSLAERGQM
ncbi:MAG: DNA repair protein RadC [Ignavibacterium sp.]|jgi:DNA repair protein RadC